MYHPVLHVLQHSYPPRRSSDRGAGDAGAGYHDRAGHGRVRTRRRPQLDAAARLGRRRRGHLRRSLQESLRATTSGYFRMNLLLSVASSFALGCYALASVLVLLRLVGGPRAQDRVFALDLLYVHAMLVVMVVGLRYQSRSEEHTSELQSLMRISYAVFC